MTMTHEFMAPRSALFLPASNARAIEKSRTLAADAVILDLEDAVAPSEKGAARAAAVAAFATGGFGDRVRVLRVNAIDDDWGADDIAAASDADIDAVLAPKVTGPEDVVRYDAAMRAAAPAMQLWVMIETCLSIGRLQAIADCAGGTRLAGMIVGTNDLALEMRARPGPDRAGLLPILSLIVAAARSRGLMAIDGVCNDFNDLHRFRSEADQGRMLGFDGKSLIHPAQIDPCNIAFSPNDEELQHARSIVAAFADPANAGRGALRLDGAMIERLHLAQAERLLRRAVPERGASI